jgi:hypothetical protein
VVAIIVPNEENIKKLAFDHGIEGSLEKICKDETILTRGFESN